MIVAAIACTLLLPAVASTLMATRGLGPFAAPYEPASATQSRASAARERAADALVVRIISARYRTPIAFAIDTSQLAGPYILASGREVLPIGGFEGGVPALTVDQLQRDVASGQLRAFLLPLESRDPRLRWVYSHCTQTSARTGGKIPLALYECAR